MFVRALKCEVLLISQPSGYIRSRPERLIELNGVPSATTKKGGGTWEDEAERQMQLHLLRNEHSNCLHKCWQSYNVKKVITEGSYVRRDLVGGRCQGQSQCRQVSLSPGISNNDIDSRED